MAECEKGKMKINELYNELVSWGSAFETWTEEDRTCDTCKAGNMDEEIKGIAVSMFATPDVIRKCAEIGANLLIVHEPTYYNHWDDTNPFDIGKEKQRLIEENNLTIFRFHDHAHGMGPDLIYQGELKYLGLKVRPLVQKNFAITRVVLEEEMTARDNFLIIKNGNI